MAQSAVSLRRFAFGPVPCMLRGVQGHALLLDPGLRRVSHHVDGGKGKGSRHRRVCNDQAWAFECDGPLGTAMLAVRGLCLWHLHIDLP